MAATPTPAVLAGGAFSDWWAEINGSPQWQHGAFYAICAAYTLVSAVALVGLSAFDSDASLEVLDHPILDLIYYTLTEILPSTLVLFILRKLPPKRVSGQYHPIR